MNVQNGSDIMESVLKRKRIIEPLLIGQDNRGVAQYTLRAYDSFIRIGENLPVATEILIKFFYILNIKGTKNIILFKNFWFKCIGMVIKDAICESLIEKLNKSQPM